MKKLFVVAVLSIAAGSAAAQGYTKITEEQKQRIIEYATWCAEQNLVDKPAVRALKDGQFSNADQKVKCFTNCFLEKAGLLVNGRVQNEAVLAKLGAIFGVDKVRTAMTQCNDLQSSADNCERAFELYKCFFQTNATID